MLACYFRNLFENEKDGIVQSGCVLDRTLNRHTNFIYASGSYSQNYIRQELHQIEEADNNVSERKAAEDTTIDIFVLASYSLLYIRRLFVLLEKQTVRTIILPYLTPIQRLMIAERMPKDFERRKEMVRFLDAPYRYLKEKKIENIYFLYGNGKPLSELTDIILPGAQFELVEEAVQKLVNEMEGMQVPLVKAGYIVENQWIFYFGVYGPDIRQISQFVREELKEEIDQGKVGDATEHFLKRFGRDAYASIAMYHGPLYDHPTEINSLMTGKVFHCSQACSARIPEDGTTCALKCQHDYDYDMMQHHKNRALSHSRFGIFLLGNINMKRHFPEIAMRFWNIRDKVRAVSIPNCGVEEYWNVQILKLFHGNDMIYWFCPIRKYTSTRALLQIVTESSYNRLIQINQGYGFCLSGYLVPIDEEGNISS